MGKLAKSTNVYGRKGYEQEVPAWYSNIKNDPVSRNVYLMNDGYFYLNVDYSSSGGVPQKCVLQMVRYGNKSQPYKLDNIYQFDLWTIENVFVTPRGAGKSIKSKKPVKKLITKKPVKKSTTKKPTTKKPVKKTTTKKPTTKKPVKKTTTKKKIN